MPTRKLGFSALMTAVYARLTTNILTSAYAFYNRVPPNTAYPYHVIGKPMGVRSARFETRDTEAEDNAFQIDTWMDKTSGLGDKACSDRMNNIIQALTGTALTITGYNAIHFYLDYSDIMLDPDHPELELRHGICRFRQDMSPA